MTDANSRRGSTTGTVLVFLLSSLIFGFTAIKLHYQLPTPVTELVNSKTGLPQLSETAILRKVRHLSETIGYRTVGTREHALGDQWALDEAYALQHECQKIVEASGRALECEVFRQEGNGTHRFDMMDRRVYKNYVNLSNILFRLSNGTAASKEHSVLINAHIDSTLPSPGAADDAIPAVIMMDCIRVLINTPDWTPQYSIVFLWNNAEESLQDGSHLFSTQSPLALTTRAVINLEAAGVSGPELLFQATSEEMIEAYSHVPRPFGTVLANDIFASGIILSDTDFRQFQEYGNLTGLDMAIVGDSYLYHTRGDVVDNVEPGATQHMAENVLALLQYLTSSKSPLPKLQKSHSPPKTIYMSILGKFFIMWSFETGTRMYNSLFAVSLLAIATISPSRRLRVHLSAGFGILGAIVGALVASNLVAVLMTVVLGRNMSWFAVEWSAMILYGIPSLIGMLSVTYLSATGLPQVDSQHLEYTSLTTVHLLFSVLAVGLQFLGLGSAGAGFVWALSSFAGLLAHYTLSLISNTNIEHISPIFYVVAQIIPCTLGVELAVSHLDIFVPLTGRIGDEAPGEHIVATIAAILTFTVIPFSIPLAHRLRRKTLRNTIFTLIACSIAAIYLFSSGAIPQFDRLHPRRVFVLHTEDATTGDFSLHISVADAAPGFPDLVKDLAQVLNPEFNASSLSPIIMDEMNGDWDVLYPFSQFLTPYKIPLHKAPSTYTSPWRVAGTTGAFSVRAENDVTDLVAGTRSLTLVIDHPGIIWSVIAFDAHVISWSLDESPLPYNARHHVKEASFYGTSRWTLPLVLNTTASPDLKVMFQGIEERGMWPGKRAEGAGVRAMEVFEQVDAWMEERSGGAFDVLLLGCVGGVVQI